MSAANANTEYGRPSDGMLPQRPNSSVKIAIAITGWRMAQAAPSTVCL